MSVYYVNAEIGNDGNDGTTENTPKRNYRSLALCPGDSVLFARGTFMRDTLETVSGDAENPVTYGAYGEGSLPVFCGSSDVSSPEKWECVGKNIWKCLVKTDGDVGNLSFNDGEYTAALKWTKDELCCQGDFFDDRFGEGKNGVKIGVGLFLFSKDNPGLFYSHIEAIPYGKRRLVSLKSHIAIKELSFLNSGVHGAQGKGVDIKIERCVFRGIGGCVWNRERKIRFGNAIELWDRGADILVSDCDISEVYDSCVTYQGGKDTCIPAERFLCRGNRFSFYGMAAFEYRDRLPVDSYFENNICEKAGKGFSSLSSGVPRNSEIYPLPMGHHIFLWRMERKTDGGGLFINGNHFGSAPNGAAIYSLVSADVEEQIHIDGNFYEKSNPALIIRFGGKDFSDFEEYRRECGRDTSGVLLPI